MHCDSMEMLERHRGHFYNWYDTQTRLPLAPLYVSTVDSGNLAGHLLTLRPGLAALPDAPILNRRWVEGVSDTLRGAGRCRWERTRGQRLRNSRNSNPRSHRRRRLAPHRLPPRGSTSNGWLHAPLTPALSLAVGGPAGLPSRSPFWADALARHCADLRDDLMFLAPWLALQARRPANGSRHCGCSATGIPTLRELSRTLDMLSPLHAQGAAARHRQEWPPSSSLRCGQRNLPRWTMTSCSTRCAGNW